MTYAINEPRMGGGQAGRVMTVLARHASAELSTTATLGELVIHRPARAELFERLTLDYCCGGAQTLAEACIKRGLDPEGVRQLIEAADATAEHSVGLETRDWRLATLTELCDHIVEVHHDGLRRDLPQIAELTASVMRVHGPADPDLRDLPNTFRALRYELEPHLELEERVLFPACRALEQGGLGAALSRAVLDGFEHDHREVGDALAHLREVTDGYDTAGARCRTHRRLLERLHSLELDIHQHVHEENNILLPRLHSVLNRGLDDIAPASASRRRTKLAPALSTGGELPRCCRGWLAEQTHRGVHHAGR